MLFASPPSSHRLLFLGGILVPGGVLYLSCSYIFEQRGIGHFALSY